MHDPGMCTIPISKVSLQPPTVLQTVSECTSMLEETSSSQIGQGDQGERETKILTAFRSKRTNAESRSACTGWACFVEQLAYFWSGGIEGSN